MTRIIIVLAVMLGSCASVYGWSNKEHIQLTRLAGERLMADEKTPAGMKAWLKDALPDAMDMEGEKQFFLHATIGREPKGLQGLSRWAIMPDWHADHDARGSVVEPFGVHERLLHYLDVEYFKPGMETPQFKADLSSLPKWSDFPRDMKDGRYKRAGMLPFRVEDCYGKLVAALRDVKREEADRWGGYLAHYLADATQPHHGTMDYKSLSYFPGRAKAPNVHHLMEHAMCDDPDHPHMALRKEYWREFVKRLEEGGEAGKSDDPWEGTIQTILRSYEALPLIGQAAQASAKEGTDIDVEAFFHFRGKVGDEEMTVLQLKARQQTWAVYRIERMLLAAWRAAHDE